MSLRERLIDYMVDAPKTLDETYGAFPQENPNTIRGRLNENVGKYFHRVGKGMYVARKGDATAIILEGNCWELIKNVESNSVDTIITDSPYSCLNKHLATGTTRKKNNKWEFATADIDAELLKEMWRVLKVGGHFFNFLPPDGADTLKYNYDFIELAQKNGFVFNKRWIWDKMVLSMGYNGRNIYEQILFFSKGKRRFPYDLSICDVLHHKRISPSKRIHETEKPVELIMDIMRFSNKENDLVLDTFAGSLSVAEAGTRLGINTINIELDPEMVLNSLRARGYNEI